MTEPKPNESAQQVDRGLPEAGPKVCSARLTTGGWCLREDGHTGEHAGIAGRPFAMTSIHTHHRGMKR